MTQATTWGMHTEPPAPPTAVAIRINDSFNALLTMNSGASAPAYAETGTWWLDTSVTPHLVKIKTDTTFVQVATLDDGAIVWNAPTIAIADVTGLQAALDAKVPTSRTIGVSGLATGGGDLSANRTITVPLASQATAEAGVNNTDALTALRTAQAIAAQAVPLARLISAAGLATGGGALSADRTITVTGASQAEAEAGSSNTVVMTPLRTAQAIAALAAGLTYIGSWVHSGDVANVDFTDLGDYLFLVAVIGDLDETTNGAGLQLRTSTDNGSNFASGASDYDTATGSGHNALTLTGALNSAQTYVGFVLIGNFNVARPTMAAALGFNSLGVSGKRNASEVNNAIRFFWTAGNFDAGRIDLYGFA